MDTRRFIFFAACVAMVLLAATSVASAGSISTVVAYGDSLSDNGNLYAASGYPPAPYWNGRFSNGPVTVEQLATNFGATLYDFAWGGATSGIGNYLDGGSSTTMGAFNLPGIQTELAASAAMVPALAGPNTLFVVWGGANDFLTGGTAASAAANIDGIVATLQADGAQRVLVPGMPDLGQTPDFYGNAMATLYAEAFNADLLSGLPSGAVYFDTFAFLHAVVADPAAYGFTNVTDPCFNGTTVCANPSQYLFWDGFHPTTAADAYAARAFADVVPEPSMFVLVGTGLAGILVRLRRSRS